MNLINLPTEIIGIIIYNLNEKSLYCLSTTCKRLKCIAGFYWMQKVENNICDLILNVLDGKLHIINNKKLFKQNIHSLLLKIIILFQNKSYLLNAGESEFYTLFESNEFNFKDDIYKDIFCNVSYKYLRSYKLVYFQMIYNQIYKRRYQYKALIKLA